MSCNPSAKDSSVIISCPEADNVTILLLEHQLLSELIAETNIHLFSAIHPKIVDQRTKKPAKKAKETATVEEFTTLSSKVKLNFYINVRCLYTMLSHDIENIHHPIESIGAISILTGNDKSPGIRHVSKKMALNVFRDSCKEGVLASMVDEDGRLVESNSCKSAFYLMLARIYFHMYRVTLRKLTNITWESIVSTGLPNFKLLRDIGYQHNKGKLDKVPPVDGALHEMFLRSVFQAHEYDQIFEHNIINLNPERYGFEKVEGGLKPRLNRDLATDQEQFVASVVDQLVTEAEVGQNLLVSDDADDGDAQNFGDNGNDAFNVIEPETIAGNVLQQIEHREDDLIEYLLDIGDMDIANLDASALLDLTIDTIPEGSDDAGLWGVAFDNFSERF